MPETAPVDPEVGAKSLLNTCIAVMKRHRNDLWEVNDAPIHVVLPVCQLMSNPEQLGSVEASSSQLKGHLGSTWVRLIQRNVPGWERILQNKKHKDGRPWTVEELSKKATYKSYKILLAESEREQAAAEEKLRSAVSKAAADDRKSETQILDKIPAHLQERRRRSSQPSTVTQAGNMTFTAGSRTQTNTSKGVLKKIQRELSERKLSRTSLSTPTHLLSQRAKFLPPTRPGSSVATTVIKTRYQPQAPVTGRPLTAPRIRPPPPAPIRSREPPSPSSEGDSKKRRRSNPSSSLDSGLEDPEAKRLKAEGQAPDPNPIGKVALPPVPRGQKQRAKPATNIFMKPRPKK